MNRCKLLLAALIGTLLMPSMTAGADTAVCPPSNAQGWKAPAEAKTATQAAPAPVDQPTSTTATSQ